MWRRRTRGAATGREHDPGADAVPRAAGQHRTVADLTHRDTLWLALGSSGGGPDAHLQGAGRARREPLARRHAPADAVDRAARRSLRVRRRLPRDHPPVAPELPRDLGWGHVRRDRRPGPVRPPRARPVRLRPGACARRDGPGVRRGDGRHLRDDREPLRGPAQPVGLLRRRARRLPPVRRAPHHARLRRGGGKPPERRDGRAGPVPRRPRLPGRHRRRLAQAHLATGAPRAGLPLGAAIGGRDRRRGRAR